jgi:hypothetical protein
LVGHDLSMRILYRFYRWLIFARVIALFTFVWPYVRPNILCTQLVICLLSHFIHIWHLGWPWSEHANILPISRMYMQIEQVKKHSECLPKYDIKSPFSFQECTYSLDSLLNHPISLPHSFLWWFRKWLHCRGGSRWGGALDARPPPPLKLEKIWFFGVKSWFFTRNTPTMFAPSYAQRNFFKCAPPLTWNPGSTPALQGSVYVPTAVPNPDLDSQIGLLYVQLNRIVYHHCLNFRFIATNVHMLCICYLW